MYTATVGLVMSIKLSTWVYKTTLIGTGTVWARLPCLIGISPLYHSFLVEQVYDQLFIGGHANHQHR